jgi:hypothetical protein
MKYFLLVVTIFVVSCSTKPCKQESSLEATKKEIAIKRAQLEALRIDKDVNKLTGSR